MNKIATVSSGCDSQISKDLVTYSSGADEFPLNSEVQQGYLPVAGQNGALEALKLDPAVLEARVIIDCNQDAQPSLTAVASTSESSRISFERAVRSQQAALLSLSPEQYELLLRFADTLRQQRLANQVNMECGFCKNNGKPRCWYASHALRNWRGRLQCPVLRASRCPRCGATGDQAHTPKYCPQNLF